jgi:hypothetical protein
MSLDANPRDAKGRDLNRRTYKAVKASLFNEDSAPGTFDLMNKGITCIASSVKKISDHEFEIAIEEGGGIADGGHTYHLLVEAKEDPTLPKEQHVEFRVITGLADDLIPDIAKGLNTGMQVKDFTIENLKGSYQWLKEGIANEAYAGMVGWSESDDKEYDVADLLCLIECVNVHDYPNDKGKHPYAAYEKSSSILKSFAEDADAELKRAAEAKAKGSAAGSAVNSKYQSYAPIMKDVFRLYDKIRYDFRYVHNKAGGSGGKLKIVDEARGKDKKFTFPFGGLPKDQYRLNNGAAIPILAAFRNLVEINSKTGKAQWRGGFGRVLELWEEISGELVAITVQATKEHGRSPNQIGKARSHWNLLHLTVDRRASKW